jgi:hypothetical protein
MTLKDQLIRIASVNENPGVSISLNTHRTHPDNLQDEIVLKNLLKEAESRLLDEFNKRDIEPLLSSIKTIPNEIDVNYNLDSLHLFLSNGFHEIVKSTWPTPENKVEINENFSVRQLIKEYNRSEEYLILKLTQNDVHLYEALNDAVSSEIENDTFPENEGNLQVYNADRSGDPNQAKGRLKEFINRIDKALVQVYNETGLYTVVIASDQNFQLLMEMADKPSVYIGHSTIDNNRTKLHELATQAWEVVQRLQFERRSKAIEEMKEAVSQNLVITDLIEIYQAAIDGRGDLLVANLDYSQPVKFNNDREFDLAEDASQPDIIDDIVTNIAWEVLSKKGRVVFTRQEELNELGQIALKTRY